MNERPAFFGRDRHLLGILTSPEEGVPGGPAIVLLNAGLLHRVGPNRMNVDMARRFADLGLHAFRFDLSGVGDSGLGEGGVGIDRAREDVREAMDEVERETGVDRFVLVGLCTGAHNAFRAALADDRVVGCVLIDGYGYPTARSRFRHYRARALRWEKWAGWLRHRLSRTEVQGDDLVVYETEVVPKGRFGVELSSLIQRDAAILMVYTEYGPLPVNYPGQLADAFPDLALEPTVGVIWYPRTDHTFSLPGNRLRLMDDVESWAMRLIERPAATGGAA